MKPDELREWVEGPPHDHRHDDQFLGYACQVGDCELIRHGTMQDARICNLTEALRQAMERIEQLEELTEPEPWHHHRLQQPGPH